MQAIGAQQLQIAVGKENTVSALLVRPPDARACLVLGHGAGAGMTHPFMAKVAEGLGERGVATLRYQFPYMEKATRRPDPPALAHATVRAAVAAARRCCPELHLLAGGKSFGGRMTSQAQAIEPLGGVHGLAFLGFPLHPAGKPSVDRAEHLSGVHIPMLFVQGSRDNLAETKRLESTIASLGSLASLHLVAGADHSFAVRARSSANGDEVMCGILDVLANWIAARGRPDD